MAEAPDSTVDRAPVRLAAVRRLIEAWALVGGLVLIAVIVMNVYSIAAGSLGGRPLAGDFELVEMGVAIAVFAFLPYCTLSGGHVSADVFTEHAGPALKAVLAALAAVAGVAIAIVLAWRMSLGLADQLEYGETTAIIGIPIWWAYVPIVVSLALLVAAALVVLVDAIAALRQRRSG